MTKQKNPAAVALGKKRWKGTTKKERQEAMKKVLEARWDKKLSTDKTKMSLRDYVSAHILK